MVEVTLNKVYNSLIIMFRLMGLWPTGKFSICYRFYGFLILSTCSFLFTATMMIQLVAFTAMDQLTETMYMALTEFVLCMKIINFYLRIRSMKQLLDSINQFKIKSSAEQQLFDKRLKMMYMFIVADYGCTNTAHFLTQVKTLLAPIRTIAFPAWHPFGWENNTRNYWLIFVFQFIAMVITSNIQVVIEMYPNLMLCMITTQFEILSMRLRNLGYFRKNLKNVENLTHSLTAKERLQVSEDLKHCIEVHYDIKKYPFHFT